MSDLLKRDNETDLEYVKCIVTGKKEWETFILGLRTGCKCKNNKKPY